MFKHHTAEQSRVVKTALERLPASTRVLHALRLPSTGTPLEHLVIGPHGVFAVEVVIAIGTVKARKDSLWLGDEDLSGLCLAEQRKASELGRFMSHTIVPVLCIVGAKLPAPVVHLRHVVVCSPEALPHYITGGPRCLDGPSVQSFTDRVFALVRHRSASHATVPLPPPMLDAEHGRVPNAIPRRTDPANRAPSSAPRPQALRPSAVPRSRRRHFASQVLGTAAGTAICIVGAWAAPAMSQLTARGVDQFVQATDRTKPVEPAVLAPNTTTAPTPHDSAPEMTEGSSVPPAVETQPQVEALPTLHFTCPVQGKGWNASPAPTAEQSDARGYHLWYSTSPGAWNYWGLFRSGIESPGDLTGLQSGEEVDVRMDRMFHPDSDGAPTMLMFTAPDDAC